MRAGVRPAERAGTPCCLPIPAAAGRKGVGWQKPRVMKGGLRGRDKTPAPIERGN